MNFLYIPLDNRPCNILFPVQLAKLQGVEVKTPPACDVGNFTDPCNYGAVKKWIYSNCENDTRLILSVDSYAYGSLLDSRTMKVSEAEATARIKDIKQLKKQFPNMKIYGFSVIMRTSISTFSQLSVEIWEKVNCYSQLIHKVELFNNKSDIDELKKLTEEIPTEVLTTFLEARKRNHAINKLCVEYVKEGIFEDLSLTQEDSTPYGVHKQEQYLLSEMIEGKCISAKVRIHNGTDEGGCLSTARCISDTFQKSAGVSYSYLNDCRDTFVASYEDRPFHENLLSQLEACGLRGVDSDDSNENQLVIYSPVTKQYEASFGDGTPPCDYTPKELDGFAIKIADMVKSKKRVYLLDVAYANGGQGDILRRIARHVPLNQLAGYAAWNTASNSLGTILAQILLSQGANAEENNRFTAERFLDDYAYQGVVRQRLGKLLREQGEDTLYLKDKALAQEVFNAEMNRFLGEEDCLSEYKDCFSAALPWPRIFEAEILIED